MLPVKQKQGRVSAQSQGVPLTLQVKGVRFALCILIVLLRHGAALPRSLKYVKCLLYVRPHRQVCCLLPCKPESSTLGQQRYYEPVFCMCRLLKGGYAVTSIVAALSFYGWLTRTWQGMGLLM